MSKTALSFREGALSTAYLHYVIVPQEPMMLFPRLLQLALCA